MDIIYIVRPSGWGYCEELRYSLRSLAQHARNVGRVIVAGDIPQFLSDEVVTVSLNNPFDRKSKNLVYRLNEVIASGVVSGDFLVSSDDIFHLRDFDADRYPDFCKNGAEIETDGGGRIADILNGARDFMLAHGLSVRDYGGGHCLHRGSVELWRANAELIQAAQGTKYGVPLDLLLGAMRDRVEQPQHTDRRDIKICSVIDYITECGGADCFSTADNPQLWEGDKLLNYLYPKKCKYERD